MSQNPGIPPRTAGGLEARIRESLVTRALIVPVQQFIHIQGVSSIVLLLAAVAALVWANSPWHESYHHVWDMELRLGRLQLPVHAWINDALMAIFFFLVGMEIKHEIVHGELSDMRRASLPIFAALGGMIVPALIYAGINFRQEGAHGWGIPMATDIAFSLGVLAMVKGIPSELKVFLLSLAIADDIGAIAVIAVFYTETLRVQSLIVGAAPAGDHLSRAPGGHPAPDAVCAAGSVVLGSDSAFRNSCDHRRRHPRIHGAHNSAVELRRVREHRNGYRAALPRRAGRR